MIPIDFSWFALLYVGAGMALIFGIWLFYDIRDRKLYEEVRERVTFHCIKCGHIYTGIRGSDVSACPQCGFENTRLKF